ncbi:rhodanese-like domain-containing protein [Salinicoccus kekensis]|uniref:Rhodanese-related sulfurtransferase n=1 Tax=Salinicoccus kekensis TaxID=714307 RepID=A0A285U8I4_9STAP|nr:rhodanese-like domain-containing protein [Salinicoccus kekensis]SOC37987.1 rhodanese-related sulfurtransferase [Salinicoccus kekensis]
MAKTVHVSEINDLIKNDDAVLIDVRETDELKETGYVPGAIHLPMSTLSIEDETLKEHKGDTLYIMCRSGKRSENVQHALIDQGYDAVNVEGGILEYEGEREEL